MDRLMLYATVGYIVGLASAFLALWVGALVQAWQDDPGPQGCSDCLCDGLGPICDDCPYRLTLRR